MAASAPRRLPGIRVEVQAPALTEVLPRMDVACFVGIASSGPLDKPVAVESFDQFVEIYGDACPLAWDSENRSWAYGNLAPTVRAFFRNGGIRSWITRVAGPEAETGKFPVPGLLGLDEDGKLAPVLAEARSEGSWCRALSLSSAISMQNVSVLGFDPKSVGLALVLASRDSVQAGDLLSVRFDHQGCGVMFPAVPDRNRVTIPDFPALWFRTDFSNVPAPASQAEVFYPSHVFFEVMDLTADSQQFSLLIAGTMENAPKPGSLVRVVCGTEECWIRVRALRAVPVAASPVEAGVEVTGDGLWCIPQPPADLEILSSPPVSIGREITVEKLTFDLWVRKGDQPAMRMTRLGFEALNPRFWGALPNDQELYPEADSVDVPPDRSRFTQLWQNAASPRFALSGTGADDARVYFPAGMAFVPEDSCAPLPSAQSGAAQDGLSTFGSDLFLDARLNEALLTDYVSQADFIRYQGPPPAKKDPRRRDPRLLRKLQAAFGIDEITIVSIPDAVQRQWALRSVVAAPPAGPSASLEHPEWWHFLDCDPMPAIPLTREPEWGHFLDCSVKIVAPPVLTAGLPDTAGTFTLTWTPVSNAKYVLGGGSTADFSDSAVIATTDRTSWTLLGRSPGNYYFRVRAVVDGMSSDWSNAAVVQVQPPSDLVLVPVSDYDARDLLEVQRAMVRMCAARGDLFGVLSIPGHYREPEAIAHIAALKAASESGLTPTPQAKVPLLSFAEAPAFSYVGAYHPWAWILKDTDSGDPIDIPPDGAACGILARRALGRGAWIAPANEPILDVIALSPHIARSAWPQLQDAQVNLVRQDPRGFLCLSSDTLATADFVDLRPINVRRLLMLLRRLALRDGTKYVFEPNDASFHRLVARGFEAMLQYLFERGAFAGDKAEAAFHVVTGDTLNTPQSMEQGRFIVELRVAPAIPMRFLTIRLLQTDERTLLVEET